MKSAKDLIDSEEDARTSNLDCKDDKDCRDIINGFCLKTQKCSCPIGYVFNPTMTSCLKAAIMYEDTCNDSFQCSYYLFSGGMCTSEKCICAPGYHYLHGRCYKTAGMNQTLYKH